MAEPGFINRPMSIALDGVRGVGVSVGGNPLYLVGLMALIVAFCGQVAKLTEHRRGQVRRWLQARLPTGWASPPVAVRPL